jgi:hypothetical protein
MKDIAMHWARIDSAWEATQNNSYESDLAYEIDEALDSLMLLCSSPKFETTCTFKVDLDFSMLYFDIVKGDTYESLAQEVTEQIKRAFKEHYTVKI